VALKVRADRADPAAMGHEQRSDRGDIVLGWLTKLTVVLALLGLVAFDGISLALGRFRAEDRAAAAAREAVDAWRSTKDVQRAYEAALAETGPEDTVAPTSFSVDPAGAVTLTLQHRVATLVVEKVGPLRDLATSTVTTTARPAS
jgi:hypothetical protein